MNPLRTDTVGPRKASSSREAVGLVGVGLMGCALAERLMAGGFRVLGFDTDSARLRELRTSCGRPARDVREVAEGCQRMILSLPDASVVASVVHEMSGALRPGQFIIDTSTGDPRASIEMGRTLEYRGVAYLDATVSGNSDQVRRGEAVVLAGGTDEAFARCGDLFRSFARRAFHLGPCGAGTRMKLVTNLVLGLNRAALAEGLCLAKALGLDLDRTLEVLRESPAYSRMVDTKGDKMAKGDFQPQARLSQHLKDVRLILEAGAEANARLSLTETHRALLEFAERLGLGALDNSAILLAMEAQHPPEECK